MEELRSISEFNSDYTVGKKIVIEELYDIIKNSTFSREVSDNPATIKSYATINWNKIIENVNRLENLFFSNDSEIVEILKKIPSVSSIQKKSLFLCNFTNSCIFRIGFYEYSYCLWNNKFFLRRKVCL